MQHHFQHEKNNFLPSPLCTHPVSSHIPPLPQHGWGLYVEECNLTFEPIIYLVPCLPNSFLQRKERRREEARRREHERVTISRTIPPPTFFPMALELTDTKTDPRRGTFNNQQGREAVTEVRQGGQNGHIPPERRCTHLRMRTYWCGNN
jgi:hypothetical protein